MLQGYPTKNGTGISIFGDYGDLKSLYAAVHEIAGSLDENNSRTKAQYQLLMNFAYEIRKAYSGQRLTDRLIFEGDDKEINVLLRFSMRLDGHFDFHFSITTQCRLRSNRQTSTSKFVYARACR